MAYLVRHFVYTFAVYLVLNEIAQPACSQDNSNNTTTRHRREDRVKKASLVRKLMRKKPKDGNIRLMDGAHEHEGRVEIYHDERWGTICDDEWDLEDAKVVCRHLGYTEDTRIPDIKVDIQATHNGRFGEGRARYWMDNVLCDGTESSLLECRHDGWGVHDCSNSETAGVICARVNPSSEEFTYTTRKPPPLPPLPRRRIKTVDVKLAGGRVPKEGRVMVRLHNDDKWGIICGDGWSLLEGSVICRQLGLGFAQDAPQTDYFGGSIEDIVTTGVKCSGQEAELAECFHHDIISNGTTTTLVCPGNGRNFASVICTDRLPDLVPDAYEVQRSTYLEDKQLYFLQCAMEENCLSSSAYRLDHQDGNYYDDSSTHAFPYPVADDNLLVSKNSESHYGWHLETRRLLRFTARIVNKGNADFKPAIPKHLWQFHACHMHYHSMEVFAIFDVLDQYGRKVAEGHKASFCLEDNECVPGAEKKYICANYGDQGIAVGCADIYRSNIDCQWIDMTDVIPGVYTFKISVNSEMKVAESDFSNNAVICTLHYNEAFAVISNCSLTQP